MGRRTTPKHQSHFLEFKIVILLLFVVVLQGQQEMEIERFSLDPKRIRRSSDDQGSSVPLMGISPNIST
uniref:Uncharacterized protein n=1 Tax=Nelumbo nucifera TaxID=4432 RepID=A0A822YJP8_NELNU|nr:TPA_asm: hypothetical protein HUJ06_010046 [Nelumbo nucifera]